MNNNFLFNVFIFLAAACIIVPLAKQFKLGSVLGYLIIGVLIGPFGFKLIGNAEEIMDFAEFGVIMMLFLIGLELEPATLWRLRKVIAGLGSLQVILTTTYNRLVVPRFMSILPPKYDKIHEQHSIILAGYGRFGQIIGRFLTAQGIKLTVLEKDPEQIELLRKFGVKGYFGDASRLDLLKNAGADTAKLLIVAIDDPDTCLEIVKLAKQEFPQLKIYSRARNRKHAYELNKAGVDYSKREVFDSSLTMAQEVMKLLGYNADSLRRKARAFAQHDESSLRKSFAFFDQEQKLISFSRQALNELEHILQDDQLSSVKSKKE